MGITTHRQAAGFAMLVASTAFSFDAIARECWSAIGATATEDERAAGFIARGAPPAAPVLTQGSSGSDSLGPAVAAGQAFDLQDPMISLKPSAPAGTHVLRYSAVPTSYFDSGPDHLMSAIVFVQDAGKDRVVVQLKEVRYQSSGPPIDPKPTVKTVAVIDSAFDPLDFQGNVPTGRFVVLRTVFSLAPNRSIPIDQPPFSGRELVHYYIEVMLITDREPSASPLSGVAVPGTGGSGQLQGPALALVSLCPDMDMTSCFFEHPDLSGASVCLQGNERIEALAPSMDDKITSLSVPERGVVLACEKPGFSGLGWCATYAGTVKRLPPGQDNQISSIVRIR